MTSGEMLFKISIGFTPRCTRNIRGRMPEANSPEGRLSAMIAYLQDKHRADTGANALVMFLKVLSEQFDPAEDCHTRLFALAELLEEAQGNNKGHV